MIEKIIELRLEFKNQTKKSKLELLSVFNRFNSTQSKLKYGSYFAFLKNQNLLIKIQNKNFIF